MAPFQETLVLALLSLSWLVSGAPSTRTPELNNNDEMELFVVPSLGASQHECVTAILTELAVDLNLTQSCYDQHCICEPAILHDRARQISTEEVPRRLVEKGLVVCGGDKFAEHAAGAQSILEAYCNHRHQGQHDVQDVVESWKDMTEWITANWTATTTAAWSELVANSTAATLDFARHPQRQLRECWRDRSCRVRLLSFAASPIIQLPMFLAVGGPILAIALLTRLRRHGGVFHVGQFVYATRRALVANYIVYGVSYLVSTYYLGPLCGMPRPPREVGKEVWFFSVAMAWFVVELVACGRRCWSSSRFGTKEEKKSMGQDVLLALGYGKVYSLESHC